KQLMVAAEVVRNLKDVDTTPDESDTIRTTVLNVTPDKNVIGSSSLTLPTSEHQTRPLSSLGSEQQREVWQKAVEVSQGPPSEQQIREIRNELFPESKTPPKPKKQRKQKNAPSADVAAASTAPEVATLEQRANTLFSWMREVRENPSVYDGVAFADC